MSRGRLPAWPVFILAGLLFGFLPAGCTRAPQASGEARLRAFVSILPQVYFVQRVGGSRVVAEALVQPGQDPHTYEPTPRQVAALAQSKVFFRIGFGFEASLLPRIQSTMPDLQVVDTREGIPMRSIEEKEGEREEHAGEGGDPHIWMSPPLGKRQAQIIRDALIRLDPAGETEYRSNYERFAADLDAVHRRIAEALEPLRGQELLVYHPAFGYFADEYGLKQVAVQSGGKEPTARELARLIEQARRRSARVVFVQPQLSQAGARAVAEAIGGAVVPMDDLAPDYLNNLEEMARKIEEALH